MTRAALAAHLRRYPRWYAAAAVWAALLVALPVIESDPFEVFSSTPDPQPATALAPVATDLPAPPPPATALPPIDPAPDVEPAGEIAAAAPPPAPPAPSVPPLEELEPELIDPDPLDALFDLLPPPQAAPIPPELEGLVRAVAPVATYGCSGIGLASIVIAVVAPTVDGVPLERILPYLAPVTTACASFPIPAEHTVCEADRPLIIDLGGLTESPPILGLGIDQVDAIESAMAASFGQDIPRLAPALRELLDCELVAT